MLPQSGLQRKSMVCSGELRRLVCRAGCRLVSVASVRPCGDSDAITIAIALAGAFPETFARARVCFTERAGLHQRLLAVLAQV